MTQDNSVQQSVLQFSYMSKEQISVLLYQLGMSSDASNKIHE